MTISDGVSDQVNFSATESRLVCAMFQYMKGTYGTDWDAVAVACKLASGSSAKRQFHHLKAKKGIGGANENTAKEKKQVKRKKDDEENVNDRNGAVKKARVPSQPNANANKHNSKEMSVKPESTDSNEAI